MYVYEGQRYSFQIPAKGYTVFYITCQGPGSEKNAECDLESWYASAAKLIFFRFFSFCMHIYSDWKRSFFMHIYDEKKSIGSRCKNAWKRHHGAFFMHIYDANAGWPFARWYHSAAKLIFLNFFAFFMHIYSDWRPSFFMHIYEEKKRVATRRERPPVFCHFAR